MMVIFLLKPYKQDLLSYDLRLKALQYFVDNYLPKKQSRDRTFWEYLSFHQL